jgi:hypothetical protein
MALRSVGLLSVTALIAIVAVPLFGRTATGGRSSQERAVGRPTPAPTVRVRVLVHAIDDPILHHTAIRLRPHAPADVIGLNIGADQQTPGATTAIAAWARDAGLTVTYITPDNLLVSIKASTTRIEKALRVTINDYRLPNGYTFRSNDRPPTVPASLSIRSILGLSTYQRPMLPGPLVAPTPTPKP